MANKTKGLEGPFEKLTLRVPSMTYQVFRIWALAEKISPSELFDSLVTQHCPVKFRALLSEPVDNPVDNP